jgi:hypothetical protein
MSVTNFTGPVPPEGETWCAVCAAMYKAQCISMLAAEIKAAEQDGKDGITWLSLEKVAAKAGVGHGFLKVAVTEGVYGPLANWGALKVCWSHNMGLAITNGIIPASAAQMPVMPGPGGGRQVGGVPLLGGG